MIKHVENKKEQITKAFLEILDLALPLLYETDNPEELESHKNEWIKKAGLE